MLARKCLHDDRRSRILESSQLFGIPEDQAGKVPLEENLLPVLPRTLRVLQLKEDHFESSNFDLNLKMSTLAAIMVLQKSTKSIKDTERWTVAHNIHPSSSRYSGPPGLRHM